MVATMAARAHVVGCGCSRVSSSRVVPPLCAATQATASAAIAAFWREVVESQQSLEPREATLALTGCTDEDLLLEYIRSCSQLFGGHSCTVTAEPLPHAGSAAISVRVEPTSDAPLAAAIPGGESSPHGSRESALESMMDWFTAQLMACEIADVQPGNDDEIADDAAFVALGRSLLHTKSSAVTFAPTVQEMHRDFWTLVAEADYLQDGSGGAALFLAPSFSNYEMFDDFSLLIRSGLRYLVSSKIAVNAYHPLALTERLRSPVPTVHIYLDNEDLFANGDGTLTSLLQDM
mmetsp:Transcript_6740/g.19061  ORF Transcript_6740/g.19061 Transcript_6740/m.19061 type:complete len:291 (-) Transcript_6740:267-1139(-)